MRVGALSAVVFVVGVEASAPLLSTGSCASLEITAESCASLEITADDSGAADAPTDDPSTCRPEGNACVGASNCCVYNRGFLADRVRGCIQGDAAIALACSIIRQCASGTTVGCFQKARTLDDGAVVVDTYESSTDFEGHLPADTTPCSAKVAMEIIGYPGCP